MHQPGLSADLDSFDLLDLVQVIQMARRDLSLVVRAGSQRLGMLRFSQGELLWAEFGTLRGEEAFMALAAQHSGSIEELAWDGRTERNVTQPLSRLVMQSVEYRETYEHPQLPRPPADTRSRPVQPVPHASTPGKPYDQFNGSNGSPRLTPTPPGPLALEPEEESAPSWVRELHSAQSASSSSSFLREEMAVQIPEPTIPMPTPPGGIKLSPPGNGSKPSSPPGDAEKDDPPTVPLRSVQGGLLSYATKREPPPQEPPRAPAPGAKLVIDPLLSQAATKSTVPVVAVSPTPEPMPNEMLPDTAPLIPPTPPPAVSAGEPKLSSLAILEQLAYGSSGHNGSAEAAAPETSVPAGPLASPAFVSAAPTGASPAPAVPSSAPSETEKTRNVQDALETFAEQVGAACIATAVIRSDGLLLAEYKVRRGQDQDLSSPAYHMANVMQSSLRALLMGGWGDLEDTFISGSTHSVMLRRLGRAEKGLYHVAVLERTGNPGLCRVRMRNNEAALLQMLSVDLPTATS